MRKQKMRTVGWLFLFATTGILLAACATSVPAKKTSEDCLVLIPTTIVNKTDAPMLRAYHFKLNMGYDTLTVGGETEGFMLILIHEPGVKIVGIVSDVSGNNASGQSQELPVNIDLPYKRGEVVVTDFTFTQTLEKVEERRYMTKPTFERTSDEGKAAVLEQFRKRNASQSWM